MSKQEITFLSLRRPITAAQLREEIAREREKAQAKLKEGEELDNAAIAEIVDKRHAVKLALVSATRRKSYDRNDARVAAQEWVKAQLGVEELNPETFKGLDDEIARVWVSMWEATNIVGALVVDKCINWKPPENIIGWADVEDWIFEPALGAALELNPQWAIEIIPEGN